MKIKCNIHQYTSTYYIITILYCHIAVLRARLRNLKVSCLLYNLNLNLVSHNFYLSQIFCTTIYPVELFADFLLDKDLI